MTNFVPENSLTTAFHAPTRISLRTNPAPIGSSLQPVGDAPFRGETDRTLALRQARDDDRGDERSIRPAPGPARRNVEVGLTAPEKVSISTDGTKKYLYRTSQNHFIESDLHPRRRPGDALHLVAGGCRMGCRFCATGRQGLQHSLSTNEILNQIGSLPERERLTNVVFMGMGEPLDNLDNLLPALEVLTSAWGFGWSPTRITVSTAGVASRLERFLEATQVHLAVSLHNPFPHERAEIMPVEKAWPIREVVEILRRYDFTHQRRVSFEYIVMSGLNDSPRHIRELCRLLDGIKCRINLIRFHKIPGSPYFSPDDRAMIAFRDALTAKGIHTTIRTSRGEDIQAACGLLSTAQNEAAQF